ncbi:DNA repair protein RecN [Lishizhenia sp.]|uniref:DNA repair protein RecN n=1 Tax=Lishizhenia sp. TaxID=2497594 RepID=UPI00299F32A9|nr:DNA repair protein RecN [Lishizhenia sp.]MDX1444663.1 DNA repair protein RecN [Lishizhenia sp.]
MLKKLTVQNFALIENAQLDFEQGFTVITGETGSGKSILLGALSLILGERANYAVIRNQEKKTIVEAVFDIKNYGLPAFFETQDLDFFEETIIRREISANGKSRAFVNDSPVQLSVLKQLSEQLIYINSQHHTLALRESAFQLDLLDTLAGTLTKRETYRAKFKAWKQGQKELSEKKEALAQHLQNADFVRFQLEELEALDLDNVDFEAFQTELNRAENAGDLGASFSGIDEQLSGEGGVLEHLRALHRRISGMNLNDEALDALLERIKTTEIELDDIAQEAGSELSKVEVDPQLIDELTEKVNAYNSQLKKHNVLDQSALIEVKNELQSKDTDVLDLQEEIDALILDLNAQEEQLMKEAQELSSSRTKKSKGIAKEIVSLLQEVKLADSQLVFDITSGNLTESGQDKLTIKFTPNKGMDVQPIEKAASGGELSRLFLCIQSLLSKKKSLPTLIFDEIDTGVSGEVADRIGKLLKAMGESMQLFAITHLPQVASKGEHHIKVAKENRKNETFTTLDVLNKEERVVEVAKLMSGSEVNDAALANAEKLMQ